mmetsp:Transcript_64853/g.177852  ORF Transcript_64853/g.177852 Transcript_64853/m.177852 type:complete len:226 (-) Transcript_64853:8-685(-)
MLDLLDVGPELRRLNARSERISENLRPADDCREDSWNGYVTITEDDPRSKLRTDAGVHRVPRGHIVERDSWDFGLVGRSVSFVFCLPGNGFDLPTRAFPFTSTRHLRSSGLITEACPEERSASYLSKALSKYFIISTARRRCCLGEQCISSERMSGNVDVTKASRAIAWSASLRLICVVSVWPCLMMGSPSEPSQQSSSMQRQPCSSTRRYMPVSERDQSWWPSR